MKREPAEWVGLCAVIFVACERVAFACKVRANLVFSACVKA